MLLCSLSKRDPKGDPAANVSGRVLFDMSRWSHLLLLTPLTTLAYVEQRVNVDCSGGKIISLDNYISR